GRLRQRQRLGQRIAERVPRKAGEKVPAQPLGGSQRDRERENARWSTHPEKPRERERRGGEQRQIGRQSKDRERDQPGERLGVDQERNPDPIEAGDEITEPEQPSD